MAEDDYSELVWENGQILMRKRSTTPSCISYTSHSKPYANDNKGGQIIHNQKKPRFSNETSKDNSCYKHSTVPGGENSSPIKNIGSCLKQTSGLLSRSSFEDGIRSQSLSRICNSNSQQMNSRNLGLRNFSLFLKLGELPKANNGPSSSGFHREIKSKNQEEPFAPMKNASCSNTIKDLHENPDLVNQTRQVVYPPKELPPPDEQSEAPIHGNDHTCYSLKRRKNEESEGMASFSENVEEEQEHKLASNKRRRTTEVHNLSERKRRDKINKKMRALQALLPNSDKVDKASMLDNAIEYLKTLQLHLQIMSTMGTGFCMPTMMQPNLGQFSGMGLGLGMPPFLNSPMLGLAGRNMLPMAVSQPPFMPLMGVSSTPLVPVPPISSVMASAPSCSSIDGVQKINSEFQESIQARRESSR